MPEYGRSVVGGLAERDVVRSLVRGLEVLRAFDGEHPALTLDETAERTGISRSATRRLLRTLVIEGLMSFDGHHYRPTARLLDLGYAAQSRLTLAEVARPHCADLSRQLGRTVSLGRLDGDYVLYLVRVGAPRYMAVGIQVGTRLPAYLPALGRVMLAHLTQRQFADYLASDLYLVHVARGKAPGPEQLTKDLAEVRQRGWSYVSEALETGLSAVAVPVRDRSGRVVAGLNVSTPTGGRPPRGELLDAVPDLRRTAERIKADVHPVHLS